jgi:hypothetical protein
MRPRFLLPAVLLPAALAACGSGEQKAADSASSAMNPPAAGAGVTGDSGAGMMAPGTGTATSNATLADPSTAAQLDSVSTAAKSGLTSLPATVAVPLIRSLEDKLDNSNDPALTDIAKDLEKLREELDDDDGKVDGKDVGEILRRLGPKVTAAASKGGAASSTLTAIGAELTKAGGRLR